MAEKNKKQDETEAPDETGAVDCKLQEGTAVRHKDEKKGKDSSSRYPVRPCY